MGARQIPNGGSPERLGATITEEGVGFSVYSESASAISVCLFDEEDRETGRFELDGHSDNVFFGEIAGVGAGARYGLRVDGPYDLTQGYYFDPHKLLVDPWAKRLDRTFVRSPRLRLPREAGEDTAPIVPKAIVTPDARHRPRRRHKPRFIYELNVRQYTMRHPSVQGPLRGTIAGLTSKWVLNHLEHLGVDTVELMPVAAWIDEGHLPALGLTNAWGYNPITYFALDPRLAPRGPQELRALTDTYRKAGIAVILDVVYNHTGEGDSQGPVLSMKGLDARTYYRHVEADGQLHLVNDAGTGNTLRCDHPAVQRLVIESLKHWVNDSGVSGFRFDLATVLGRYDDGFRADAELIQKIKADPVLSRCILIAEPWDPGPGGYHLGAFGREFGEWNDRYRDDMRKFWKGEAGMIGALAGGLAGSADVFNHLGRKPSSSINFIAAHDGFTLADLVAYEHKHNDANGEDNRDGHDANYSWNNGVEGPTEDEEVLARRTADVRALLATLFLSHGTPMIGQGDELGRSQQGNNNAYAQDNEITWLDWENSDGELVNYVAALNDFRRRHKALVDERYLTGQKLKGVRDVVWLHPEGRAMDNGDWEDPGAGVLGMHLNIHGDELLVWFNRHGEAVTAHLPASVTVEGWHVALASRPDEAAAIADGAVTLPPRSVVALEPGPGEANAP